MNLGFGGYGVGNTLNTIMGIAFYCLNKFPVNDTLEIGLNVAELLETFKQKHPEQVPQDSFSGGLLAGHTGSIKSNVNDFELAMHLMRIDDPSMAALLRDANGVPVLMAYLAVRTVDANLPTASFLESALPFAANSLKFDVASQERWNKELKTEISRLAPLASTGLKFKGGKPKGAIGPLAAAIRERLRNYPKETPKEVWSALAKKPPKGLTFCDNNAGKYVEYEVRNSLAKSSNSKSALWGALADKTAGGTKARLVTTQYGRFRNIVIEQRKNIESCTD